MAEATLGKLVVRLLMDNDDFDKGAKDAASTLGAMGSKFSSLASTMNKAVVGAFAAATAAVAAFGAASAVTGAQFEQAITTTAAISKDGLASIGALTDKARELGATTAYSATQAADAMQDLARAGMSTDEITAASEAALYLAGSVGAEMSQATGIMASAMSQFQLDASEAARVSDVFSTAMRTTLFDMSSLTEAMKYAGTVGNGLGMSLEDTTAAVAMFRNLGLEGSMAGTNFRMSMSALVAPSDKAATAIRSLGLNLDDVNPAMTDFGTIMQRFGDAGLDAATAIEIFGQRSGTNVAAIASQFADGTTKFRDVLGALKDSAGSTVDTYESMMDTVLGQWQILRSAIEELSLTVFDSFAGPLQTVLETLSELVQHVAAEFKASTGRISSDLQGLADQFAAWVGENKDAIADTFKGIADIIQRVIKIIPALVENLDKIAFTVLAVYAAVQTINIVMWVGNVVIAVQSLIPVILAVQAQIGALMAQLTAATGGFYLIVAAIGAVVAALVGLGIAYTEAERSARALEAASLAVEQRAAAGVQAYADRTAEAVAQSKALQAETRQLLAEEDALTAAREEELDLIRDLTDEDLAGMVQRGEMLTDLNGQIRTVKSLYEEWGEDAMPAINAGLQQHRSEAGSLADEYDKVAKAIEMVVYLESQLAGSGGAEARLEAWGGTVEAAQEYADGIDDLIKAEEAAAAAIEAELQDARAASAREARRVEEARLADEKRQRDAAARQERARKDREVADAKAAAAEIAKAQEQANASIMSLETRLHDERQRIGLEGEEARRAQFEAELGAAQATYMEALEAYEGNIDAQQEVLDRWEEYRKNAELAYIAEEMAIHDAALEAQAAQERARAAQMGDTLVGMEMAHQQRLTAEMVAGAETRREKIAAVARQGDDQLRALDVERERFYRDNANMTAEERAAAEAYFAGERQRIARATQAQIDKIGQESRAAFVDELGGVMDATKKAGAAMVSAFKSVGRAVGKVFDSALGALGQITGFAFDLVDLVGQIQDAKSAADEGGGGVDVAAMATEMVDGLIDGAVGMVETFVDAAPVLIGRLAERLPELIGVVVDAVPLIVGGIVEALPGVVQALVSAIPKLIGTIKEALPSVVAFLASNLPIVIDMLLAQIPRLVRTILAALPSVVAFLADAIVQIVSGLGTLVQRILSALPEMITGVLASIPQIINAVVDAVPQIIDKVIKNLPAIIMALINGVLDIVVRLAQELPVLIGALLEMVPELIVAVINLLPELITSILAAIPQIIMGIIDALPRIITALVMMSPQIITGLLMALPQIIVALVDGLIFGIILKLPLIIYELVVGIYEGLRDALIDLFGMMGKLGESARSALSGGSAYGGVDYVPAPMRVTVHPGEAIVPADRNATAPRRGDGSAPPAGTFVPAPPGQTGAFRADITVEANGRELDRVLVESMDGGQAPKMSRKVSRASGVVTGYNRGRLNKWGS